MINLTLNTYNLTHIALPRRKHRRRIGFSASVTYFKPAGIPVRSLEEILLEQDELEALRLADLEGLYHEEAASRMGVSRQTFGRIISSARQKSSDALVNGKAIRISE